MFANVVLTLNILAVLSLKSATKVNLTTDPNIGNKAVNSETIVADITVNFALNPLINETMAVEDAKSILEIVLDIWAKEVNITANVLV